MKDKNKKCSLFPYVQEDVVSLQDAMQKFGWSITAFDLPSAWAKCRGEGVKVAVLDTGCDLDHPDLKANILPGINLVNPSKEPWDDNNHGTHVAGIIAAENNEIGMVGVAPHAKIMPVKVLDSHGNGDLVAVAKGIRWAADNGADLICMSLGSPNPVQEVRKAIQYAQKKGVVCFVAAGNSGLTKRVFYPADYSETIAIGSIDENMNRSNFSNTGENLDFMAPGNRIISTVPDNWYAVLSGTSMAAPFVAGLGALLLSHARSKGKAELLRTADGYIEEFKKHTTQISDANLKDNKFYQGFGIIDPKKLFETF
jgi:subtilisin family serine protease